ATGFELESMRDFNHLAIPGWIFNGKILKRRHFSRNQLKLFNVLVPAIRRIDPLIPGKGLGIIAVARKV
ncbi:MAG: glycosyl transferase family 2, partial [Thermoanaerobaculia bacterium]